jgi:hypothetical protein
MARIAPESAALQESFNSSGSVVSRPDPDSGSVFIEHRANLPSGGHVTEIEIGAFPSIKFATPDWNIAGRDGQYPCRSVPLRCYAGTQETARQVKSETRHPLA